MKIKLTLFFLIGYFYQVIPFADTCPAVQSVNFSNPPPGWSLLLPPVIDNEHYHFASAIHSLNGAYYEGHVICKYAACPNAFCPAFALISDNIYEFPNIKESPWNERSVLAFTLTCTPPDHNPTYCRFQ